MNRKSLEEREQPEFESFEKLDLQVGLGNAAIKIFDELVTEGDSPTVAAALVVEAYSAVLAQDRHLREMRSRSLDEYTKAVQINIGIFKPRVNSHLSRLLENPYKD